MTIPDRDAFQVSVGEWAERTFTQATDSSIMAHLGREFRELRDLVATSECDIAISTDHIAEETADCFLLLLHLAHRCGFSLLDAADRKFTENRLRQWGQPDHEGVSEHLR